MMIKKAFKYIRIMLNPVAFEKDRAKLQASVEKKDRQIEKKDRQIEKKDRKIEVLQGEVEKKDRQIEALLSVAKPTRSISPYILSERFQADGKPNIELNALQVEIKNQIDIKVKQGVYSFEKVLCCICGGHDFETLSEKDRYGLYAPAVICVDCGLVQTNPRMSQEAYQQFYEIEYSKLYRGVDNPHDYHFDKLYNRGRSIYSYIAQSLGTQLNQSRILEVGCSSGGILQYLKEKGNQVCGCDLNPETVGFGRDRYGLELQVGTVYDVILSWKPDVVIYSHTLEHILNPLEELEEVRSIMAEDAILYIELPGIKYIFKQYDFDLLSYLQNAHAYYFTLTTLKNLLRKAGFDFIHGDEFIRSIFRAAVEPQQNARIENDYGAVMEFLGILEYTWQETMGRREERSVFQV